MTKNKAERGSLEFYLDQKYPVTLYPDHDGGYVAEIKDLPGCMTQGETAEEALAEVEDVRILWIETAYEYGDNIPLPSTETQYSGKTLLRMPRSLHQKLAEGAEREGVSLNQYIISLLSEASATKTIEPLKEKVEAIYHSLYPLSDSFVESFVAYTSGSSTPSVKSLAKYLLNRIDRPYYSPLFSSQVLKKLLDHEDELTQIIEREQELDSQFQELIEKAELDKEVAQ